MSVDIEDFLDGYYFVARRGGQLARYALGVELREDVDPLALAHLRLDARDGVVEYPGVRAWFAANLVPARRRTWPP